jgi:hypothetical protein
MVCWSDGTGGRGIEDWPPREGGMEDGPPRGGRDGPRGGDIEEDGPPRGERGGARNPSTSWMPEAGLLNVGFGM